ARARPQCPAQRAVEPCARAPHRTPSRASHEQPASRALPAPDFGRGKKPRASAVRGSRVVGWPCQDGSPKRATVSRHWLRWAASQPANLNRLQRIKRKVWHVDIQQKRAAPEHPLPFDLLDEPPRRACRSVDMCPSFLDLRKGDGRYAKKISLHGRTDRTRVDRVIAHV